MDTFLRLMDYVESKTNSVEEFAAVWAEMLERLDRDERITELGIKKHRGSF